MRRLSSIFFWIYLAVTCVLCFIVAVAIWIVTTPFDRKRRINHAWSCVWSSLYAYGHPGWRVRTIHRDRIASDRAYVLCANHTSIADVVLLFTLFKQFKWVSKRSNFRVPVMGWNMWLSNYIPLVRGDKESTQRMLEACRRTLRGGISIMMFPEGTRSRDGNVQPFKRGAFSLARECGVDVVPIAIHGGHSLIPKHGATFAPVADLTVEILEPVASAGFVDDDALGAAVREKIVAALAKAKEPTPQPRTIARRAFSAEVD